MFSIPEDIHRYEAVTASHHNHLWRYTLSSKGKSYSSKTDAFLDNFQMANNKEIFQISGKKLAIF